MKTIETSTHADADGKLRIEVPVDNVEPLYHVVVVLEEMEAEPDTVQDWPIGYMDSVIGKWQGEFQRTPEGPFELRESL